MLENATQLQTWSKIKEARRTLLLTKAICKGQLLVNNYALLTLAEAGPQE